MNNKKEKIGILGGSFDPAHKGHLTISQVAAKKLNLKKVVWAITKKNPLKKNNATNLQTRISQCKKFVKQKKFIKVKYYEKIIKSNKTIDLVNHLTKKNKFDIYFIMGADNLINFHKWHKWEKISQKCKIIVFDRHGYKKKSLNSMTFKRLNNTNLKFIEFNKVNISSSKLRKI